jgi:hypothetical protein
MILTAIVGWEKIVGTQSEGLFVAGREIAVKLESRFVDKVLRGTPIIRPFLIHRSIVTGAGLKVSSDERVVKNSVKKSLPVSCYLSSMKNGS